MKKIVVHTGDEVQISGQYKSSGGHTEYTFVEGKKVPPNNEGARQNWFLVDKTKHHRR